MTRLLSFTAGLIAGLLIAQLGWLLIAAALVLCLGLLATWVLIAYCSAPVLILESLE